MLKVYNTLTRKMEDFHPLHPPFVGMYVCGPTVYDDPHLGHAKSYVSFDIIFRFLREEGYNVRYVQNITDVGHLLGDEGDGEDRVLKRARIEKLEPVEIAQKYENHFFRDMDRLNCLRPNISCRATGHIPDMIEFVEVLLKKGYAYEVEGNVYFDISKFKAYGKLSGRRIEDLKEGVRVEVAEGKKHPADFALWKKAQPEHLMQWNSPWGRGFPGWHLECSVMAMKYLGESIDIHGGGLDNQFPHHECEIAQSESATGKPFVKYWLHNNMVTRDGQKMSKSLGNHMTLSELFEKYDPMTVRFFILQGHYRSPQDFSDQALDAARKGFEKLSRTIAALGERFRYVQERQSGIKDRYDSYLNRFIEHMRDDFNTAGAISVLFELSNKANEKEQLLDPEVDPTKQDLTEIIGIFKKCGEDILGLKFEIEKQSHKSDEGLEPSLIQVLIDLREQFRKEKNWTKADEIRDRLAEIDIAIEDFKDGTKWKKIN
ncbi:MAG: cysteine--tRNA ligase [bacterium]